MSRALVLLGRALRLRCPACGGGGLLRGWFGTPERCSACGFRFEREEGYFLGAMFINVIVAELLFLAVFAATLLRTWPTPPWTALTYGSVAGVVLFPIVLYPFSRSVWLAFDLTFHPPASAEFDPPQR